MIRRGRLEGRKFREGSSDGIVKYKGWSLNLASKTITNDKSNNAGFLKFSTLKSVFIAFYNGGASAEYLQDNRKDFRELEEAAILFQSALDDYWAKQD